MQWEQTFTFFMFASLYTKKGKKGRHYTDNVFRFTKKKTFSRACNIFSFFLEPNAKHWCSCSQSTKHLHCKISVVLFCKAQITCPLTNMSSIVFRSDSVPSAEERIAFITLGIETLPLLKLVSSGQKPENIKTFFCHFFFRFLQERVGVGEHF